MDAQCGVLMPSGVSFTGFSHPRDIPPYPVLKAIEFVALTSDRMLGAAPRHALYCLLCGVKLDSDLAVKHHNQTACKYKRVEAHPYPFIAILPTYRIPRYAQPGFQRDDELRERSA